MNGTFSRPLQKKRTDFSFKSFIDDPAAVRKVYDEQLGGNPFGIKPNPPIKPRTFCTWSKKCNMFWDGNERHGVCEGSCLYD